MPAKIGKSTDKNEAGDPPLRPKRKRARRRAAETTSRPEVTKPFRIRADFTPRTRADRLLVYLARKAEGDPFDYYNIPKTLEKLECMVLVAACRQAGQPGRRWRDFICRCRPPDARLKKCEKTWRHCDHYDKAAAEGRIKDRR